MTPQTLTRHKDIQSWVSDQHGVPAIRRVADSTGRMSPRLTLRFIHRAAPLANTPSQDDGMSPCSWTAWLAELDRQHLALRVTGNGDKYEFVPRKDLN